MSNRNADAGGGQIVRAASDLEEMVRRTRDDGPSQRLQVVPKPSGLRAERSIHGGRISVQVRGSRGYRFAIAGRPVQGVRNQQKRLRHTSQGNVRLRPEPAYKMVVGVRSFVPLRQTRS